MSPTHRFDAVDYDAKAISDQAAIKELCELLEDALLVRLKNSRSLALALTSLEEAHMWAGKAIRDDQMMRTGA